MHERDQRVWAAQWKDAALALEGQRWAELRSLTAVQALAATETLLSLAPAAAVNGPRKTGSGLVEQQRILLLARAAA
jgi:hypothetical protein